MTEENAPATESIADYFGELEVFTPLEPSQRLELARHASSNWFEFGDTILEAGALSKGLYIVRSGTVRVFSTIDGRETSLGVRKTGALLDELGALREHSREYSVRASTKTELLFLPREALAEVLAGQREANRFISNYIAIRTAGGAVNQLFDLKNKVEPAELEQQVRAIGVKRVAAGDRILEQDSEDDRRLYIVQRGRVKLTRSLKGVEYHLATLNKGDSMGEASARHGSPQFANAVAEVESVLLVVPEEALRFLLERNPQLEEQFDRRSAALEREAERQEKLASRRKRSLFLDLDTRRKAGEKVLSGFPLIEQAEEADCGAACLAMICRHYKLPMTLGKLRDMAGVTSEGATLDSLARVGEAIGFTTRGVQCTFDSLRGFELPFIAHWEGFHYIVVYGVSKRHIWVADPGRGFARMTRAEFERGWAGTCLLFTPGPDFDRKAQAAGPWKRFIGYLAPHKTLLGYLLLATLIIELLGVAPPIIVQNILDRVVVHHSISLLHVLIAGLIISHVFIQLTSVMRGLLSAFLMRKLDFAMISQFFKHTLSLPLHFFDARRTGDIFARFQENMTVRDFMTESTISTLLNVMMVFIYFFVLFLYSAKMTLMLIAFVIPIALFTLLITPRLKQYAREEFEASTDAEATLMETISGAETVKAMGIEKPMRMRWERKYARSLGVQYNAQRFAIFSGLIGQLLNSAASVAVLWMGATLVLANELTIGQLIAFNMLMGSVMSPLMALIGMWDELQETAVAMERLGDVLDVAPEEHPADAESRILIPDLEGSVRFDNVYFRYGGSEKPYVLENISLEIEAGQMVAIVGQSGSGKTTLAKLIAGFYLPEEGQIQVDGYDIKLVDKQYFRSQIGYVMQNNLLFSGTVTENIAAGEENPDPRRVVEVARLADAHGFISAMPLGYEQIIGERGSGLSGGQMQRVCIARALYHDPRVLILDEATSALDTQSEANILDNMQDLLEGRTSIVIAHRLSTVMKADKIVVLYRGNIVEEGTHSELLAREGMYHQLVHRQVSG